MGDNYFHVTALSYIVFSIGVAGIVFSILIFLLKKFNLNPKEVLLSKKRDGGFFAAKRDSNFELLRILCIIMVIMQHFGYWGDFFIEGESVSGNTIILQTIVNVGKIGVNCFMLITGYYMVKSAFKISKVFKLAATVWFYSWGFGFIFLLWNYKLFDIESFAKTVLPVLFGQYWFITIYLIVYILSPFLNAAAQNIDKSTYKGLLIFYVYDMVGDSDGCDPGMECYQYRVDGFNVSDRSLFQNVQ